MDGMQLLTTQWRLCRIQLVNWGTFDGYTDLPICSHDREGAASVVCITGKSGTGKSTLFDAGTVLMMPYGRTLNAASNLARGGSPREVRTYLKGMMDTVADTRGRTRGKFLRPETEPIFSAIVHTWADTTGAQFSAARFFQLKPGASENDLDQTFVTMPGALDPRALRPHTSARIRARDVRQTYPESTVHEGSGKFFRTIYQTLGIGKDGNGTNAMKLLYRIQSGIPMTNVDDLFKELVLDAPSTFELAEAAIDCYERNESVWVKIDEAKRKRAALADIDETYDAMRTAAQETTLAASLEHATPSGPFTLWTERRRQSLATAEHEQRRRALERAEQSLVRETGRREELKAEMDEIRQSIFERGGGTLSKLVNDLEAQKARHAVVERRRNELEHVLKRAHKELAADEGAWEELVAWADKTLLSARETQRALQEQIDELGAELAAAGRRTQERKDELEHYRSHRTRITRQMAEARELMAQAAGLDPQSIPFAAELMDVPREQELWRTAVNISLAHIADRILVDKSIERHFRQSVDRLAKQLGRRYHYDFVDLDQDFLATPAAGHVSSKVVYREDSPFAPYVRKLVCTSTDHLCVDTVSQLSAGKGPRITSSGQERVGNRGAVGHSRNTLIIGFSNQMLIEECEAELESAQAEERSLASRRAALQRKRDFAEGEREAAQGVARHTWDELDQAGVDQAIARLTAEIERLERDDELRALQEMLERTQREADKSLATCTLLESSIRDHRAATEELRRLAGQARLVADALEGQGVAVTADQGALMADAVAQTEAALGSREAIVSSFDRVVAQARRYVGDLLESLGEREARAKMQLERAFRNYHDTFMPDDAEHGTTWDEYPYYHAILDGLTREQLDEPEQEWEASMLRDVAQHLSRLQNAFELEDRAIDDRLRPVNAILGEFAFGERRSRLGVVAQRRTLSDVRQFRRTLRRFTALATTYDFAGGEAEVRREHRALERFVDLLRQDLASTGKGARHYLDTRHMVHVIAKETSVDGTDDETVVYDSINGKSGGQYQELVAFILGAALLYCLGYNAATMPSFAPVYLDEAFIKADSEHTRRALGALSGLGFQVVIAVPDGKVEAVAPLASQIISLTKDERTGITRTKSLLRAWTNDKDDLTWQD